jgi:hypothetical protein
VDPRDIDGGVNVYAATARPLDQVDVDGLAPCPPKAILDVDENDPDFKAAKERADEVAANLAAALKEAGDPENGDMHPVAAANTTLTTMVIVDQDGNYQVVVTGNRSPNGLPQSVIEAMGDHRYIGYGDGSDGSPGSPPRVTANDEGSRFPRDNPRSGEREPTTHNHAEQRGLRATDCDPNTQGVAYIAPTKPCCEGCSKSIQSRGGTSSNVSDLGQKPGKHGSWW